jgi:hypothetical protein
MDKPFSIPYGWSVSQLMAARKGSSKQDFHVKVKAEPVDAHSLDTVTNSAIKSEPNEQIDSLPSISNSVVIKADPQPIHELSISDETITIKPEPLNYLSSDDSPLTSPSPSIASDETGDEVYFPNLFPGQNPLNSPRNLKTKATRHVTRNQSTSRSKLKIKSPRYINQSYSRIELDERSTDQKPIFHNKYRKSLQDMHYAFVGEQRPWKHSILLSLIQRCGGMVHNLKKLRRAQERFSITIVGGARSESQFIPDLGGREVRIIDQGILLHEIGIKVKEKQRKDTWTMAAKISVEHVTRIERRKARIERRTAKKLMRQRALEEAAKQDLSKTPESKPNVEKEQNENRREEEGESSVKEEQRQQKKKIEVSGKRLSRREEKRRQQKRESKKASSKARKLRTERIREDIKRLKAGAPSIYPPHQHFTRSRGPKVEAEIREGDVNGNIKIENRGLE